MKPRELAEAQMLLGLLERFGGYTLRTLLTEDVELISLLVLENAGQKD